MLAGIPIGFIAGIIFTIQVQRIIASRKEEHKKKAAKCNYNYGADYK
ncbi:MAG TPA: hypothetical protein VIO64_10855 [Pseudobacteroides sp.]